MTKHIPEDVKKTAAWIAAHRLDLRTDAGRQIVDLIEAALMEERERCARRYAYEAMRTWTGADRASSIQFGGMLVVVHPDMPPHIWNGETMIKIEMGVDLGEGTST